VRKVNRTDGAELAGRRDDDGPPHLDCTEQGEQSAAEGGAASRLCPATRHGAPAAGATGWATRNRKVYAGQQIDAPSALGAGDRSADGIRAVRALMPLVTMQTPVVEKQIAHGADE
jgi:hypothetical protein